MGWWESLKIRLFGAPMPEGDMPVPVRRPHEDTADDEREAIASEQNTYSSNDGVVSGSDRGTKFNQDGTDRSGADQNAADRAGQADNGNAPVKPARKWPERMLFVCSGNICRSAYGAAKMAQMLESRPQKAHIASCGTLKIVGRGAAPDMTAAAAERGVSLESHRSSAISHPLIDAADVIFAMEPMHRREILRISPDSGAKIVLLGNYLDEPAAAIPDPMGREYKAYRTAAAQIDEALENWLSSILSP